MKLRVTFIIGISLALIFSYTLIFLAIIRIQHGLVIGQAMQQARMLFQQLILTREWVSDHNGLFFIKGDNVPENPYLIDSNLTTTSGLVLVKRNPAMVTRELSEYASRAGYGRFRVTSLKPINPENSPDVFEEQSLAQFTTGNTQERGEVIAEKTGRVLRYIAPLITNQSCLACHAEHGYNIGDIRGALSITIPLTWADAAITQANRHLVLFAIISTVLLAAVVFLLFEFLVAKPLIRLQKAMGLYPEQDIIKHLPTGNDEIGSLTADFISLCQRLEASKAQLKAAAEQALYNEKMAALGQITAGIAHEINNPLGGLRNCVKNMKDAPGDQDMPARYLPLLDKGLSRIETIMGQLLNFGRNNPLQPRAVHIDSEIRECMALLAYRMKNIDLTMDLRVGEAFYFDSEAIKQIVINIGLNAIQAMPDGGQLRVSSRRQGEWVILEFADSGCGIVPEIIDKIYDPFFTTKEVGEGTGLGLAVSYSLIHKMGGSIEAKSAPRHGSLFRVSLPISENRMNSDTADEERR
ncbi:MAG: DUF3365 domain-containing protein [Desulfobulbaceae bacterium]|jgi:signal transduction histidine kinase|nr:DUF3365 domain-containing protein [Desulfobulbaceae bacterium]